MTTKCTYCGKEIEPGKAVKGEVIYRTRNSYGKAVVARKTSDYCTKQCATHDQWGHEG